MIYEKIAKFAKGEENKKTLRRLASEERAHCEIWESYTGIKMKPQKANILKYTLISRILGFTFALQNTKLIALSGLIVGISATFSMASSEFLSAKSEDRNDAFKSCTYTGIAYLLTVVALIAPYLLLSQPLVALATMIRIIILIIAGFTYYTSVAQNLKFGTRFLEMAGISIGVAVISFVVGILAKQLLGVDI